jgi:hypothetical protein
MMQWYVTMLTREKNCSWLTHCLKKYILLSGGLGSSRYILQRLEEHIERSRRRSLQGTRIEMSYDPQLIVVKGLLLQHTNSILWTRIRSDLATAVPLVAINYKQRTSQEGQ